MIVCYTADSGEGGEDKRIHTYVYLQMYTLRVSPTCVYKILFRWTEISTPTVLVQRMRCGIYRENMRLGRRHDTHAHTRMYIL